MSVTELRRLYEERKLQEAWRLYLGDEVSQDPEWHWYGSLVARRLDEWFPARNAIDRAIFLMPKGELAAKIRFQAGDVCRFIGEYTRARDEFEICLDQLIALPQLRKFLTGMVHYNLGLVFERLPDLRGALHHYRLAQGEFVAENMDNYLRMTLQNMAWVHLDLGDVRAAGALVNDVVPYLTTDDASWRNRMLEARLYHLMGDHTEAARVAESIMAAGETVAVDVRCLTMAIAAEIGVAIGRLVPARQLADMALELSQKAPVDSRCYHIAHKALQKVKRALIANSGA